MWSFSSVTRLLTAKFWNFNIYQEETLKNFDWSELWKTVKLKKMPPQRTPRLLGFSRTAPPYYFPALIVLQHRYMEFLWFYYTDHYVSLSIPCIYWCWHGCLKKEKKNQLMMSRNVSELYLSKDFFMFFSSSSICDGTHQIKSFFLFLDRDPFSLAWENVFKYSI